MGDSWSTMRTAAQSFNDYVTKPQLRRKQRLQAQRAVGESADWRRSQRTTRSTWKLVTQPADHEKIVKAGWRKQRTTRRTRESARGWTNNSSKIRGSRRRARTSNVAWRETWRIVVARTSGETKTGTSRCRQWEENKRADVQLVKEPPQRERAGLQLIKEQPQRERADLQLARKRELTKKTENLKKSSINSSTCTRWQVCQRVGQSRRTWLIHSLNQIERSLTSKTEGPASAVHRWDCRDSWWSRRP